MSLAVHIIKVYETGILKLHPGPTEIAKVLLASQHDGWSLQQVDSISVDTLSLVGTGCGTFESFGKDAGDFS